jgi:hypothetical protein
VSIFYTFLPNISPLPRDPICPLNPLICGIIAHTANQMGLTRTRTRAWFKNALRGIRGNFCATSREKHTSGTPVPLVCLVYKVVATFPTVK